MLSTLGEQAASRGLRGDEALERFAGRGFVFGKDGHALDAILGDADYYGTAFHHPQYVRANWSQYFDVLDVVPAAIGNHQDLVILRNTRETDRARSAAAHTAGSST